MRDRWFSLAVLRRLPGLLLGLAIFGAGIGLMVQSDLGLGPWEAFHQGISKKTGIDIGTVSILLGIPILLLWWPLGERPGIGTVLNIILIGLATNATIALVPRASVMPLQLLLCLGGVVVIGLGSGLYLGAGLGAGPRDGLMTGLHRRFGWSIGRTRTGLEVTVLALGWLLGGAIGLGTIAFAFGIGPVVQVFLPIFDREGRVVRRGRVLDPDLREELETPGTVGE